MIRALRDGDPRGPRILSALSSVLYSVVEVAEGVERELVLRAAAGEEGAFDALIGPLLDPAYKLAVTIVRDPEEGHDVVQEATFKAWRRLNGLRGSSSARAWYLAIVGNQARSTRRGRWRSVLRFAEVPTLSRSSPDVAAVADVDLDQALRNLPAQSRTVLFLYYFLDLPVVEVAEAMGLNVRATKSRIHRAVAKLRLELAEGDAT